ncbi:hypothetical protein VTK26DRAFT_8975 [Humicola hyalothermophila]
MPACDVHPVAPTDLAPRCHVGGDHNLTRLHQYHHARATPGPQCPRCPLCPPSHNYHASTAIRAGPLSVAAPPLVVRWRISSGSTNRCRTKVSTTMVQGVAPPPSEPRKPSPLAEGPRRKRALDQSGRLPALSARECCLHVHWNNEKEGSPPPPACCANIVNFLNGTPAEGT